MTTGMIFLMTIPGFMTPIEAIPTPDLAVPYAAPMSIFILREGMEWRGGEDSARWCG